MMKPVAFVPLRTNRRKTGIFSLNTNVIDDSPVRRYSSRQKRASKFPIRSLREATGPVTQSAPGLRVIIDGGEIAEIVPGQPDRGLALRLGDFYWQEPGTTRGIRNIGTTRIEIAEFELK